MIRRLAAAAAAVAIVGLPAGPAVPAAARGADSFDRAYVDYGRLLRRHVVGGRVDYAALQRDRPALDAVAEAFGRVDAADIATWPPADRIAYLVNAYNVFTLQAIVDHYPIRRRWFNFFHPANSIMQIPGVWSRLRWRVAGSDMTLDAIEHGTLRVEYDEPRIHFAVNCASVSCPPLRPEPYVGRRLERQLIVAARDFLASDQGVAVDGGTLHVSSMLDWYADDFVATYASRVDAAGAARDRAILGVIATYGPSEAAALARAGPTRVRFLDYDWSLNDTTSR